MGAIRKCYLLEVPECVNAGDSNGDRSRDDLDMDTEMDMGDPSVREVLDIIHNIDCVGDGRGEEAEVNEGVDLNGHEYAEDGPAGMDPRLLVISQFMALIRPSRRSRI